MEKYDKILRLILICSNYFNITRIKCNKED